MIVYVQEGEALEWTMWSGYVPDPKNPASASWQVYGGDATPGADYIAYNGSAAIPAGGYRVMVADILDDDATELPERFFLSTTISGDGYSNTDVFEVVIVACLTEEQEEQLAATNEFLAELQGQIDRAEQQLDLLATTLARMEAAKDVAELGAIASTLGAAESGINATIGLLQMAPVTGLGFKLWSAAHDSIGWGLDIYRAFSLAETPSWESALGAAAKTVDEVEFEFNTAAKRLIG